MTRLIVSTHTPTMAKLATNAAIAVRAVAVVCAVALAVTYAQAAIRVIDSGGSGTHLSLNALYTAFPTFGTDTVTFNNNDATLASSFGITTGSTLTLSGTATIGRAGADTVRFINDGAATFTLLAEAGSEITFSGFGAINNGLGQCGGVIGNTTNAAGCILTLGESGSGTLKFVNNSAQGNTSTIFDGGGAIFAETATIAGGTNIFTGNRTGTTGSSSNGGAIDTRSTFTISGGINDFTLNIAGRQGGAVFSNGNGITISGGTNTFTNNRALLQNGGAMYANNASGVPAFIINGGENTFTGNIANNNGGALYSTNTLAISNSTNTFTSNVATTGGGGAIYSSNALTISGNNTFTDNRANTTGGAIHANNTIAISSGTNTFHDNKATTNGGAIYVSVASPVAISGGTNTFTKNTAVGNGGAVHANAGFTITGGTTTFGNIDPLLGNSAVNGGAIYANAAFASTGGTNEFLGNRATTNGGAVYVGGAAGNALNGSANKFEGNSAGGLGGAIYFANVATVRATSGDSLFRGNTDSTSGTAKANAIHTINTLTLAAQSSRRVAFYDPIVGTTIGINATAAETGSIIFDGSYWKSQGRTPTLNDPYFTTQLSGTAAITYGTLAIQNGAMLNLAGAYTHGANATLAVQVTDESRTATALRADSASIAAGSTLNITGCDGTPTPVTIIQTGAGNVTGTFTNVRIGGATGFDFLTHSVAYTTKQVNVTVALKWNDTDSTQHGNFTLNAGNLFTVSGVLADNLTGNSAWDGTTLTKLGVGTLILSGANTYTGGTTISAGMLQIGEGIDGGGATGSIVGDVSVATGATLAFNRSNAYTFVGAITGTGAVTQIGAGTLTLTGDSLLGFSGAFAQNAGNVTLTGAKFGSTSTYTQAAGTTLTTSGAAELGAATFAGTVDPSGTFRGCFEIEAL